MAAPREQHHERVCSFLVPNDKAPSSANEIREALESNDDDSKVDAMQRAIAALLNGEQLPAYIWVHGSVCFSLAISQAPAKLSLARLDAMVPKKSVSILKIVARIRLNLP